MFGARTDRPALARCGLCLAIGMIVLVTTPASAKAPAPTPAAKPSPGAVVVRYLSRLLIRGLHLDPVPRAGDHDRMLHASLADGALKAIVLPSFNERNHLFSRLVGYETGLSAFWADLKRRPLLSRLGVMANRVYDAAARGLEERNFERRNDVFAQSVGNESAMLAMGGLNVPDVHATREIRKVFTAACRVAGGLFKPVFTEDGHAIGDRKVEYKAAYMGAGPVAREHLSTLLWVLEGKRKGFQGRRNAYRDRVADVLRRVSLEDVARVFAQDLGLPVTVTAEEMHRYIKETVFDKQPIKDGKREPHWAEADYAAFRKSPEPGKALRSGDLRVLRWGIRLANATWKSGQIHRAVWEKETDAEKGSWKRIMPGILPNQRPMAANMPVGMGMLLGLNMPEEYRAFDSFDVSRATLFKETFKEEYGRLRRLATDRQAIREAQKAALSRVVFELFLDVNELKRGMPEA